VLVDVAPAAEPELVREPVALDPFEPEAVADAWEPEAVADAEAEAEAEPKS
jgi:hypothetical protein